MTSDFERKGRKVIPVIGVDEKSVTEGQRNYVTVVSNLVRGTVEEVIVGRSSRSLERCLSRNTRPCYGQAAFCAPEPDISGSMWLC